MNKQSNKIELTVKQQSYTVMLSVISRYLSGGMMSMSRRHRTVRLNLFFPEHFQKLVTFNGTPE